MRRLNQSASLLALVAAACAGTSTGNPMDPGNTPTEAELLRSDVAPEVDPSVSATALTQLGNDNRAFAFELFNELSSPDENLFMSPYSISLALAMTYAGAQGTTEQEMADALHFNLPETELHPAFNRTTRTLLGRAEEVDDEATGTGFRLNIVNQAWGQAGFPFLSSYLDTLARHYDSGLFAVDFGEAEKVRTTINDWVAEQTEDRILDLLVPGSISSDTRLVLTNAIYFKGSWLRPFDPADTVSATFQGTAGDAQVQMMHQQFRGAYTEGSNYQAVELPFLVDSVRMAFVLPAEGAFDDVSTALGAGLFDEIINGWGDFEITLDVPRFEFTSSSTLRAPLENLGMPVAFGPGADFTGMAEGGDALAIDDVVHKAFLSLNEEGAEAAAATAVLVGIVSAPPPATITCDRPFLFAIYDEPTGQLLFLGQFVNPE